MSLPVLRRVPILALLPFTLFGVNACGGSEKDAPVPDAARAVAEVGAVREAPDSAEQARVDSVLAMLASCPRDGRWHACSVERRLSQSGLRPVLQPDSTTGIPGVPGETTHWRLGRQWLRVVLLADSAAARTAMGAMDSLRALPRGDTAPVWPERATLLRSANLVALLLGGTDRTVERVADALLAGPPQSP